jgi:hypothetical protein
MISSAGMAGTSLTNTVMSANRKVASAMYQTPRRESDIGQGNPREMKARIVMKPHEERKNPSTRAQIIGLAFLL